MKLTSRPALASLLMLGALATASTLHSQTVADAKTATFAYEGTINNIRPETFEVVMDTGRQEIGYSPKTTSYVDKDDNPVVVSGVTEGQPVKAFCKQMGDRMVATKVVVGKLRTSVNSTTQGATATTSSTTSVGVVTEISPETFLLRTESSTGPSRYSLSKSTQFVDAAGAPVTFDSIKAGSPATVQYTKVGDNLVVSKVVVGNPEPPTGAVRTTTTTTGETTIKK